LVKRRFAIGRVFRTAYRDWKSCPVSFVRVFVACGCPTARQHSVCVKASYCRDGAVEREGLAGGDSTGLHRSSSCSE
jgi:hypothetical protein